MDEIDPADSISKLAPLEGTHTLGEYPHSWRVHILPGFKQDLFLSDFSNLLRKIGYHKWVTLQKRLDVRLTKRY